LTGYLPVEQGVACYAALRRYADTTKAAGDGRTRDQIMADTLVERLTGQTAATDVNVELQIMMPLQTLLDPQSTTPATIPGYGPLPTDLARDILSTSQGRKWWRRLFTAPASKGRSGPIVGGDSHKRCFDGWLAHLIRLRDQEPAGIRSAERRSATSTTSPATPTAEPPATATAAAPANAATTPAKCPAGRSASSTPNTSTNPTP
jgi:hypothetical protein